MRLDGDLVGARLTGPSARLVVSASPPALQPGVAERLRERVAGWLPRAELRGRGVRKGGLRRTLARCGSVRRPVTYSGLGTLTVLTVDMDRGLPNVDADALMTDARIVYASPSSLYLGSEAGQTNDPPLRRRPRSGDALHRQRRGRGLAAQPVLALRAQRRAARAPRPTDGPRREQSFVTTLTSATGASSQLGQVGGLGRGERIYAVRFIDDLGYVVTFRQTDPLYTLDLSDPAAPRVVGELKILGYSAYLHPVGGDLLLGVGQDATDEGRRLGTQLSLFDVCDPANPARLQQRSRSARGRPRRSSTTTTRSCGGSRPSWRSCRSPARRAGSTSRARR